MVDVAYFWSNVDKSGGPDACWLWRGAVHSQGYGQAGKTRSGANLYAHRASWELANGPIPLGEGFHGTCVLHKCDVRLCVNPSHLFLGSNRDNARDMAAKGRHGSVSHPEKWARGERHHAAVLARPDVDSIRARVAAGERGAAVARSLGIGKATVYDIIKGRTWADASPGRAAGRSEAP